jgi:hypothetical protein
MTCPAPYYYMSGATQAEGFIGIGLMCMTSLLLSNCMKPPKQNLGASCMDLLMRLACYCSCQRH